MAEIEQAGAIVVRSNGAQPRVLLVTAKRNPECWIFPKGNVEKGETLEDAAIREAKEEAGVAGVLVAPAGAHSFQYQHESYRVHYFVLATKDEGKPEKGRQLAWWSYDDALERLTFDQTRLLLRQSRSLIEAAATHVTPAATDQK